MNFLQKLIGAYLSKELERVINPVGSRIFFQILCNRREHMRNIQVKPRYDLTWSKALMGATKMIAFAVSKYGCMRIFD